MFNQSHAKETLKYGQNRLTEEQIDVSGALTEPYYINTLLLREKLIRLYDNIFTDNKIDVIYNINEVADGLGATEISGFPSMTLPTGIGSDNLPMGSLWIARRYDEKSLFRVTFALEQILNARRNPF